MVVTNMCPKCDSKNIKKKVYGKHTNTALVLIVIGIPLCFFGGLGILLLIPGIVLGAISAKKFSCGACQAEWE